MSTFLNSKKASILQIALFLLVILLHFRNKNYFIYYPSELYLCPIVLLVIKMFFNFRKGVSWQTQVNSRNFLNPIIVGFYIIVISYELPGRFFSLDFGTESIIYFEIDKCNRKADSMQLKIFNDSENKYVFVSLDERVCEKLSEYYVQAVCSDYYLGAYVVKDYNLIKGSLENKVEGTNSGYSSKTQNVLRVDSQTGICLSTREEVEQMKDNMIVGIQRNGYRQSVNVGVSGNPNFDIGNYVKVSMKDSLYIYEAEFSNEIFSTHNILAGEINSDFQGGFIALNKEISLEVIQGKLRSSYKFVGRHYFVELERTKDADLIFSCNGYRTKKIHIPKTENSTHQLFWANCVFEEGTGIVEKVLNLTDFIH